ncbi:MAG: DUF2892 domain-containing protein [bacterium]
MKANIGSFDRLLRIIVGVIILGLGYYYKSYWGFIGIIPIITALIKWCPLYIPFNISTNCFSSTEKKCCCNKKK